MKRSQVLVLPLLAATAAALGAQDWQKQSIYQVITDRFALTTDDFGHSCDTGANVYCGGTFKGLQNHLDYIQQAGFTAVWISPIVTQIDVAGSFHGYWARDIYGINSHFGSSQDLKDLAAALHNRGMYLMVDIAPNHNAYQGNADQINYSTYNPFNDKSLYHQPPVMIGSNDYNSNDSTVQTGWLYTTGISLPDLDTTNPTVVSGYKSWIQYLIKTYDIDGFRLDTTHNLDGAFLTSLQSAADQTRPTYIVGEVFDSRVNVACPYQYGHLDGILNYPVMLQAVPAFTKTGSSIGDFANAINNVKGSGGCSNTALLGSFTENHDNPRIACLNGDLSIAQNLLVQTILADGIPIVYNGQEQHYAALHPSGGSCNDPYNREAIWFSKYNQSAPLYGVAGKMNQLRKTGFNKDSNWFIYQQWPTQQSGDSVALRKGSDGKQVITLLTNAGSGQASGTFKLTNAGYAAGTQLTEVLSCSRITVNSDGTVSVPVGQGLPKVLYPSSLLSGSGLC